MREGSDASLYLAARTRAGVAGPVPAGEQATFAQVAEADGNRTRRRRSAPSTGFEDRSRGAKAAKTSTTHCHPLSSVPGQSADTRQGGESGRNLLRTAACRKCASTGQVAAVTGDRDHGAVGPLWLRTHFGADGTGISTGAGPVTWYRGLRRRRCKQGRSSRIVISRKWTPTHHHASLNHQMGEDHMS